MNRRSDSIPWAVLSFERMEREFSGVELEDRTIWVDQPHFEWLKARCPGNWDGKGFYVVTTDGKRLNVTPDEACIWPTKYETEEVE